MAETSMFCTGSLRLFGLRGCILREKGLPISKLPVGRDKASKCHRQGLCAECSASHTLRPHYRPWQRHSGSARGGPVAPR